jgi:hypothetical protein
MLHYKTYDCFDVIYDSTLLSDIVYKCAFQSVDTCSIELNPFDSIHSSFGPHSLLHVC